MEDGDRERNGEAYENGNWVPEWPPSSCCPVCAEGDPCRSDNRSRERKQWAIGKVPVRRYGHQANHHDYNRQSRCGPSL